jgi:ankyrin repeat protein
MAVTKSRLLSAVAFLAMAMAFQSGSSRAASEDTRLARAAERDDVAGVRALLEAQADVNGRQVDGSTALLWAAYQSNVDVARLLIAAKADVNAANRYGVSPLLQAARVGSLPIIEALVQAGAGSMCLSLTARHRSWPPRRPVRPMRCDCSLPGALM